jgi:hypothetical protein
MFRLLKLCMSLAGFVLFVWFGATVKLGSHTLFEHLRAIGQTRESQELVDGTKQAAEPLVDDVKRRIGNRSDKADKNDRNDHADHADHADRRAQLPAAPDAGAPQDDFSASEKRQLRHLLGAAERHASRE